MPNLKINEAPLLPDLTGIERIPTGGRGDYTTSVDQIKAYTLIDAQNSLNTEVAQLELADANILELIDALANGATKAYLTYAELDAAKGTLPANSFARVTNDPDPTNNWLWQWDGTVLTKSDRDDLAVAVAAVAVEVADRSALIGIDYTQDGQIALKNALGFVFGLLGVDMSALNGVTLTGGNIAAKSALADHYDFSNGCFLYPTTVNYFEITNGLGFIIDELPSVSGGGVAPTVLTDLTKPLFSKTLCGWAGEPITIHVPQLLQNRAEQAINKHVTAGIISADTTGAKSFYAESDVAIIVRPDLLGTAAELHLRDSRTNAVRSVMPITKCAGVPQGTGQATKVLMIGDSILNRGGADIVFNSLTAHGYAPQMIGTMLGTSAASTSPSSTGGRLGEGREGAMAMHYVYGFTSRTAVAVGDEATYMALSKTDKANRMPFVRLTTGGDNPAFVKNGYIFDMRFYLDRFSLSDPDVVYINLGTNDLIAYSGAPLSSNLGGSLNILLRQTRTALPTAKIVVALPTPAYSDARDTLWSTNYFDAIRIIQSTVDAIADSKTFICAEWAVMPANAGFGVTGSTDTTSGAVNGAWSDDIHPLIGGRSVKYSFAAAHIVAAHLNLI